MDSFRKIDVDKYDEDVLLEEELIDVDTRSPTELKQIAQQRTVEVRSLIGKGDPRGALAVILNDPPYGDANANLEAKNATLSALLEIFNVTKSSDVAQIVKSLNVEEQDVLMKYLYKGLASPELGASAVLLGWHEKVSVNSLIENHAISTNHSCSLLS